MARPQPTEWKNLARILVRDYQINQEVFVKDITKKMKEETPELDPEKLEIYMRNCINFGFAEIDRVKSDRSTLVSYIMRKLPKVSGAIVPKPAREEKPADAPAAQSNDTNKSEDAAPVQPKKRGRPSNAERVAAGKIPAPAPKPDTVEVLKNVIETEGVPAKPSRKEAEAAMPAVDKSEMHLTMTVLDKVITSMVETNKSGGYRSAGSRLGELLVGNAA